MSTHMKFMVPLLDKEITRWDLKPETGFVGAFVHDKNRPGIDDCIFLVYDLSNPNRYSCEHESRFAKCTNIRSTRIEYIKGKPYKIFAFPLIGKDARDLRDKGYKPRSYENVVRIMRFWCGYDDDVNFALLSNKPNVIKLDWQTVPEYDFRPGPQIGLGMKKGGIPV